MLGRYRVLSASALLSLGVLAACAPADSNDNNTTPSSSAAGASAADCAKTAVKTSGKLVIGTDKPAYEPWFKDDDPTNGQGFESAVAYAVATKLGFDKSAITWSTVPFNSSYAPGKKTYDFDINQISITDDRKQAVDFSAGYFDVTQAVITLNDNKFAGATTLAELKGAKIGAQVGTTSLDAIKSAVAPSSDPQVFNDTNDAATALKNKQVDAIVTDLPTAFYLTAAEIDGSKIVGQFPQGSGSPEQFGMLFEKGSKLTSCVNTALSELKSSGDLAKITEQWLGQAAGAPELK